MIYSLAHYTESNPQLVFEIIEKFSFATLIIAKDEGPLVTHVPLLLEKRGDKSVLIGHCARANPIWREFDKRKVTAVFQGPHAYISPAWYQPQPDNVSTWNYVAVHAEGRAAILEQPEAVYEFLKRLTVRFENEYGTDFQLPEKINSEREALLRGIVAFEMSIDSVQGKFKLSQRQESIEKETVIKELSKMGGGQRELARYMELVMNANGIERN